MKLERIILGIFCEYFDEMKVKTNSLSYYNFYLFIEEFFPDVIKTDSSIEIILFAINYAEQIIFLLDGVQTPLSIEKSYTCHELTLILENEDLFDKTKFFLNSQEIDKLTIKNTYK